MAHIREATETDTDYVFEIVVEEEKTVREPGTNGKDDPGEITPAVIVTRTWGKTPPVTGTDPEEIELTDSDGEPVKQLRPRYRNMTQKEYMDSILVLLHDEFGEKKAQKKALKLKKSEMELG